MSVEERLEKFYVTQKNIEEQIKTLKDNLHNTHNSIEEQLQKLKAQEKELKEIKEAAQKSNSEELKDKIKQVSSSIKRLNEELLPSTGSLFVRLFLGQVNVKLYREDERFRLKQEYQKFKRRTDPLFISFVVVQLFLIQSRAIEILFQVWLLYYYTTLALRENILRSNGSNINGWWIIHHYLSMAISISILTWGPDSSNYVHFLPQFMVFSLFQGAVQVMQNIYQSSKLYSLIAMGKASRMDVTSEVGVFWHIGCSPGLTFLLPFLLFVQSFQLYNSYTLLEMALTSSVEWQVWALGVFFLAVGLGNLSTTLWTYRQKWKTKQS